MEQLNLFFENVGIPIDLNNLPDNLLKNEGILIIASLIFWVIAKKIAWFIGKIVEESSLLKGLLSKIWMEENLKQVWGFVYNLLFFGISISGIIFTLKFLNIKVELIDSILSQDLPKIWMVFGLVLAALVLASITKAVVKKVIERFKLEEKIWINLHDGLWNIWYFLVIIFFLPKIITNLGENRFLAPISDVINSLGNYSSNIIESILLITIWFIIAKVIEKFTVKIVNSIGSKEEWFKINWSSISKFAGIWVFTIIFLLISIKALDNLKIETADSIINNNIQIAIDFMHSLLNASILIIISYVIGKLLSNLFVDLLTKANFNSVLESIGLKDVDLKLTPSEVVWRIVLIYIMFFAWIKATKMIGIESISWVLDKLLGFGTSLLFGCLLLGWAMYLANYTEKKIKETSTSEILPIVVKIVIIGITGLLLILLYT